MQQINLTRLIFLTRHLEDTLSRGPEKGKVSGNWLPTYAATAEPLGYLCYCVVNQVFLFIDRQFGDRCDTMSSEEFEKLHEIFKSLYDELQLIPDKALRCHGGKHTRLTRRRKNLISNTKHNPLISNVVWSCRGEEEIGEDIRWEARGGRGSGELFVQHEWNEEMYSKSIRCMNHVTGKLNHLRPFTT